MKRQSLHWSIFFLISCALFGVLFRMIFPTWLPYTVGLLLVGFFAGVLGHALGASEDCPMYALMSNDVDGDNMISRAEWDNFVCVGCVQGSVCLSGYNGLRSTCGDGSANPAGCRWTFDQLNSEWKTTMMLAESNTNTRRLGALFDRPSDRIASGRKLSAAAHGVDLGSVLTADDRQ